MAKFNAGDEVWVPISRLPDEPDRPYSLTTRTVLRQQGRSVVVDVGREGETTEIASRWVHPSPLGVLLLRVGDFESEGTLLDPLAKSILQYLRLLIPDDILTSLHVRTAAEIEAFMRERGDGISHVVLVAHGRSDAVKLPAGQWMQVDEFVDLLELGANVRTVISLACETGDEDFGVKMTTKTRIIDYVGPTSEVHGVTASLFAQHLLARHLLLGDGLPAAIDSANKATPSTEFAHWRNGKLQKAKPLGRPPAAR